MTSQESSVDGLFETETNTPHRFLGVIVVEGSADKWFLNG